MRRVAAIDSRLSSASLERGEALPCELKGNPHQSIDKPTAAQCLPLCRAEISSRPQESEKHAVKPFETHVKASAGAAILFWTRPLMGDAGRCTPHVFYHAINTSNISVPTCSQPVRAFTPATLLCSAKLFFYKFCFRQVHILLIPMPVVTPSRSKHPFDLHILIFACYSVLILLFGQYCL